jgi:hypothetical protein
MLSHRPVLIRSWVATALFAGARVATAQVAPSSPPASPEASQKVAAEASPVPGAAIVVVPRAALEQLEAQLDDAVAQVSRPSAGLVVGRVEGTRGYQLPGYGAIFVLAPRALPHSHREVVYWSRAVIPPGAQDVMLEPEGQDLLPVPPSPEPGAPGSGKPKTKGRRIAPLDPEQTRELAQIEAQVQAFQREAEEARQAAERDLDRLTQEFQVLLAPPTPQDVRVPAPAPPAGPATRVAAGAPPTPRPPTAPVPPLPPPWRFWFDAREAQDERTPERVVADVRTAVVDTLEAHGPTLPGLRPEEFITVAVDFLPGGLFVAQARPTQTIVVRARVRDLGERARGQLSPEALRGRIEVVQY